MTLLGQFQGVFLGKVEVQNDLIFALTHDNSVVAFNARDENVAFVVDNDELPDPLLEIFPTGNHVVVWYKYYKTFFDVVDDAAKLACISYYIPWPIPYLKQE